MNHAANSLFQKEHQIPCPIDAGTSVSFIKHQENSIPDDKRRDVIMNRRHECRKSKIVARKVVVRVCDELSRELIRDIDGPMALIRKHMFLLLCFFSLILFLLIQTPFALISIPVVLLRNFLRRTNYFSSSLLRYVLRGILILLILPYLYVDNILKKIAGT